MRSLILALVLTLGLAGGAAAQERARPAGQTRGGAQPARPATVQPLAPAVRQRIVASGPRRSKAAAQPSGRSRFRRPAPRD